MAEKKYWFARRFPVGHPRNAMAPVSTEGWAVVGIFIAATIVGTLGLVFLGLNGQLVSGFAMFVILVLLGGGMFVGMAQSRGDRTRTVDDYKGGRA